MISIVFCAIVFATSFFMSEIKNEKIFKAVVSAMLCWLSWAMLLHMV